MDWLKKNSTAIQSIAAISTAIIAIAALIGVKIQLDEADRLQNLQSAREAYRAHLALAISNPDLAEPADTCTLLSSPKAAAYTAFIDHLLYTAEQMLDVEENWEATFKAELQPHLAYLCSQKGPDGDTSAVLNLLTEFKSGDACAKVVHCD